MCFAAPDDQATQDAIAQLLTPQCYDKIQVVEAQPSNNVHCQLLCTYRACGPEFYHNDEQIHTKVISGVSTRGHRYFMLNLLRHEPKDLVEAAITSFDNGDAGLTGGQKRAINDWQIWLARNKPLLDADQSDLLLEWYEGRSLTVERESAQLQYAWSDIRNLVPIRRIIHHRGRTYPEGVDRWQPYGCHPRHPAS